MTMFIFFWVFRVLMDKLNRVEGFVVDFEEG